MVCGTALRADVLCMQEGRGQGLLLRGVEGSIGRFLCRLGRQGCPCSLQQVQSGSHYFAPQATWLGSGRSARKDRKARVDVLMRLSSHDETRLPGLEAVVADLRTYLDEFLDFKKSCWRNVSV